MSFKEFIDVSIFPKYIETSYAYRFRDKLDTLMDFEPEETIIWVKENFAFKEKNKVIVIITSKATYKIEYPLVEYSIVSEQDIADVRTTTAFNISRQLYLESNSFYKYYLKYGSFQTSLPAFENIFKLDNLFNLLNYEDIVWIHTPLYIKRSSSRVYIKTTKSNYFSQYPFDTYEILEKPNGDFRMGETNASASPKIKETLRTFYKFIKSIEEELQHEANIQKNKKQKEEFNQKIYDKSVQINREMSSGNY